MVCEHLRRYTGPAGEPAVKSEPVKPRPRIRLAARRDVLVADHRFDRIAARQRVQQGRQCGVLSGLEAPALEPFEFDADRVVIAVFPSLP